jgi:hypothetical protein
MTGWRIVADKAAKRCNPRSQIEGLWWASPIFFVQVRLGERGALVWSCGTRDRLEGEACGIPHLAKNERDAPNFLYAAFERTACAPFIKERRRKFREPTKLHRKSGMWGTRRLGPGWSPKPQSYRPSSISAKSCEGTSRVKETPRAGARPEAERAAPLLATVAVALGWNRQAHPFCRKPPVHRRAHGQPG